jgi:hypothetical protein
MGISRRTFLSFSAAALGALATHWANLPRTQAQSLEQATDPALHVLNRLTWGARPEDIARIQEMGIEAYIDWQLDYTNIPDPAVDNFVGARRILTIPLNELSPLVGNQYGPILETMLAARLFRALYSERQLYERMVEFWTDHFNIPIGDLLAEKIVDDREVIRAHALGSFRELLFASARSAAMLYYLNNDSSTAEHPNENYAREIMELHTLGVDGGYTEQDVIELARALTGWTVRYGDGFYFDPDTHDWEEKTILSQTFPAGRGVEEGLQMLDLLANHPSTARFICFKLCRRFVSDTPPETLVASAAAVFSETSGDIRAVMRHILTSGEFMTSGGQKFRRPFDFVVAAMRALSPGLQVEDYSAVIWSTEPLGHIPFFWGPPNGYPEPAGAWINTNGLLHRWNIALNLAEAGSGYVDGVALNLDVVVPIQGTVGEQIDAAAQRILGRTLPDDERALFAAFMSRDANLDEPMTSDIYYTKLPGVIGLLLASPHFQWI